MDFKKNPHNSALKQDFAKTVLMPGDPLRAKFIAENFLTKAKLVNNVRAIGGYTGFYKDKKISVMASGMGMPSIGIYSYELFNYYDVDNIIRVGSAGAISDELNLRDIVLAQGACTNSSYASQFNLPGNYAPISSFKLLNITNTVAKSQNIKTVVGNVLSADNFYNSLDQLKQWQKMNVLCVEMEAAALFMNAAQANKNALAILTISDCPLKNLSCTSLERQNSFTDMITLALESSLLF